MSIQIQKKMMTYATLLCFILFQVAAGEETVNRARRATGLIIDGENAGKTSFPEFAWIFSNDDFYCGGTILNETTIVTAANCSLNPLQSYKVIVGKYRYGASDSTEQMFDVAEIIVHEDFNYRTNDIALFFVNGTITFNNNVKAATLAKSVKSEVNKTLCYAVGAGTTGQNEEGPDDEPRVLQKIETNFISRKECRSVIGDRLGMPKEAVTKSVLCTQDTDSGVCYGDVGGPVGCYNKNDVFVTYGIQSYGSDPCIEGFNVFTRVSAYKKWIRKNARKFTCC